MIKQKIVVCGATGNQGGAVADSLILHRKFDVVALTRDPESARSKTLADKGAIIVKADMRDVASLNEAFLGAYGVFGVTQPWSATEAKYDIKSEIIQGKNIIWAAKSAKLEHLLFSTFLNFSNRSELPGFLSSKIHLEQLIKDNGLPYTILRPGIYMENIISNLHASGSPYFTGNYHAETQIPYVALEDIGEVARLIFDDPDRFLLQTVSLLGDYISGNKLADLLSTVLDKRCIYKPIRKPYLRLFSPEIFRLRRSLENPVAELAESLKKDISSQKIGPLIRAEEFLKRKIPDAVGKIGNRRSI